MHKRFNPRPRMGGDPAVRLRYRAGVFQSTPPHGGRLHVGERAAAG